MTEHAPLLLDARAVACALGLHVNSVRRMSTTGTLGPRPLHYVQIGELRLCHARGPMFDGKAP